MIYFYCDASAVIKRYLTETGSPLVHHFFDAQLESLTTFNPEADAADATAPLDALINS